MTLSTVLSLLTTTAVWCAKHGVRPTTKNRIRQLTRLFMADLESEFVLSKA